jgi:glycine amidinotransferase
MDIDLDALPTKRERLLTNPDSLSLNSYDEWSSLKEIIVGSPVNFHLPDLELSFKLFFQEQVDFSIYYPSYGKKTSPVKYNPSINKQYLEEVTEDVEELVATLQRLNILVRRPTQLNQISEIVTPYWKTYSIPALNVRDQAIIFGNHIIETPPQIRARYFENDLLKEIFYHYFNQGCKWTAMPRPMMTDHSFDVSYAKELGRQLITHEEIYEQIPSIFDVGIEMMIDAAQCIRFGKDVVVNVATKNHELGLKWLNQHLGHEFRFHRVERLTDSHIDSILLPLRPGKLLLRHPKFFPFLPDALQKWDIIYPPEPKESLFPSYSDNPMLLTSKYIDLNVLSINENQILVNSLNPELIKALEKHGFDIIPVRHRHRRLFGGGFHCFTLDTVREGKYEDYFS